MIEQPHNVERLRRVIHLRLRSLGHGLNWSVEEVHDVVHGIVLYCMIRKRLGRACVPEDSI